MNKQKAQKAEAAARYADAVVRVLAEEFPTELRNAVIREIVADAVFRHAKSPSDMTEIIVDDPVSANWRLKPDRNNPARVRLAFCPVNPERRDEREHRVNVALAAISSEEKL